METSKEIVAYKIKDSSPFSAYLSRASTILKNYLIENELWVVGRNITRDSISFAKNNAFYDAFVKNGLLDELYEPIYAETIINQSKQGKVLADQKALYDLKLHETQQFNTGIGEQMMVTRVGGGWLYMIPNAYGVTTTFVPFVPNKEF